MAACSNRSNVNRKLNFGEYTFTMKLLPRARGHDGEKRTTKNENSRNVETEKEWKKDVAAQEARYYNMGVYIIVQKERKPA